MLNNFLLKNSEIDLGIGNTVLLLHMENSIGLVDSSINNSRVMLRSGSDAKLSTNEKKFGDSGLWSSNDAGIYVPRNPQNQLYDHDFTIEGFFWLHDQYKFYGHRIIGTYGSPVLSLTDCNWLILVNGSLFQYGITFFVSNQDNEIFSIRHTPYLNNNRWYHFAVVRAGNTFSLYLDGNLVGQKTQTQYIHFGANDIYIATSENGGQFSGYLDEIRIKKTVEYTSNFAVPTAPFNTL